MDFFFSLLILDRKIYLGCLVFFESKYPSICETDKVRGRIVFFYIFTRSQYILCNKTCFRKKKIFFIPDRYFFYPEHLERLLGKKSYKFITQLFCTRMKVNEFRELRQTIVSIFLHFNLFIERIDDSFKIFDYRNHCHICTNYKS